MLGSLAQRWGHRRWFAWFGRAQVPLDRLVGRLTRGRLVAWRLGPSLLLTTTGRRSGEARTNPLLYARDGDTYVVMGSNWGQAAHPAWTGNLLARPEATITLRGRRVPVRATLISGAERARLRDLLLAIWPAYATYENRAAGRHIRIFRLTPSRLTD